eukprot:154626_1
MGNCFNQKPNCLINTEHQRIVSPLLQNTLPTLEIWSNQIKDSLTISSGYSFYTDHTVILDCILSYILYSTPIFVDNQCKYNSNKREFEFRFHDDSNKILNVNTPKYELDVKLNDDIMNDSFNVVVSKSGYIFITSIAVGWTWISHNTRTKKRIIIYSKIYENQQNEIYIQSPWKTYEHEQIQHEHEYNYYHPEKLLVSNYWGLIGVHTCSYMYDDADNKISITNPINDRKYSFKFQNNFSCKMMVCTKKELIHIGLLNEDNSEHKMEYIVVCEYAKKKNILILYELPTGKLVKRKYIKNMNGLHIIYFNINTENQCLLFVTKSNKKRLSRLKLSYVKIMKYSIIKQQILTQKCLSNSIVPKTGHWRCQYISYFDKNIDQDWVLTLGFGDGASELSELEIQIIFDQEFNEKQRIRGPEMYLGMGGPSVNTKKSDVDWIYRPHQVSFDPPV